ncbi:hypothetical protein E3E31_03435 [Thermococcus sp. M39]|uniref:DUF4352 domain-containing protein n=1 Tax=unclassified Thermococcus TaxID=2627626 RepID=UPI00143A4F0C|nr:MULTISPECIES: DUF4352 domain-containing protein [unclassified Thermococcus]NJE07583.1 hypothetical protein [Thermococcus sp. M39]NJE12167.1 hypothetical protein [Thermococcus sp. LS2]
MRKAHIMLMFLLTIIISGCLQSQPFTSHTSTTTQQKTISLSNMSVTSPTTTTTPIHIISKEQIKDFKLTVNWKESANVLVLYLEVQNQTTYTKIDGKLKVTIRDEFGFLIYNGTLTIHKSDFQPYTGKFTGVSENLTKVTVYKARYIITDFQKGVSSSGIVNATLIAGNTTLKRTFIAMNLPKMNEKERGDYFENLYLKNAKPLNITQIDGDVALEFYRYGIYIHYGNLRKYLRIDAKLRNIGNYSIEVIGRKPAKLTVDGFPVEEYHSEFWYGYPKKLEPGEYIKEIFLFPMEEIILNSEEFVFKVQETEIIPERKVTTKLSGLKPLLEYKNANISKVAQKFPIEITLVKYAVFEYETFEGKERGIKVILRIKNTGNKEITVDLNEISLGGNVKIAPINWLLTVSPNSEKEVWLLFPYVQGKTELTVHLYDLIEYKEEFLEIPLEIEVTPKPNEIGINKTIEAYPLVITLEKVEKISYLEISKLKPLVKVYFKLKNIGESSLLLNVEQWKLITSEGIIRHGDIVMSNISGNMELSPGSYASGYVAFNDIPDDTQYNLEITIPSALKTITFNVKLPIRLRGIETS